MWGFAFHSTPVEVGGQLAGVSSLLPCGIRSQTEAVGLNSKHLHPFRHNTGPTFQKVNAPLLSANTSQRSPWGTGQSERPDVIDLSVCEVLLCLQRCLRGLCLLWGGLNKKRPPQAYVFEHLVPSRWYCVGRLWNLWGAVLLEKDRH